MAKTDYHILNVGSLYSILNSIKTKISTALAGKKNSGSSSIINNNSNHAKQTIKKIELDSNGNLVDGTGHTEWEDIDMPHITHTPYKNTAHSINDLEFTYQLIRSDDTMASSPSGSHFIKCGSDNKGFYLGATMPIPPDILYGGSSHPSSINKVLTRVNATNSLYEWMENSVLINVTDYDSDHYVNIAEMCQAVHSASNTPNVAINKLPYIEVIDTVSQYVNNKYFLYYSGRHYSGSPMGLYSTHYYFTGFDGDGNVVRKILKEVKSSQSSPATYSWDADLEYTSLPNLKRITNSISVINESTLTTLNNNTIYRVNSDTYTGTGVLDLGTSSKAPIHCILILKNLSGNCVWFTIRYLDETSETRTIEILLERTNETVVFDIYSYYDSNSSNSYCRVNKQDTYN